MKRKVLCRITSFALAAILAAQSCMTASAVETGAYPVEAAGEENGEINEPGTEEGTEESGETEQETETGGSPETEPETESSAESEQESGTESSAETESGTEGSVLTEAANEQGTGTENGETGTENGETGSETESMETSGTEESSIKTEETQDIAVSLDKTALSLREGESEKLTVSVTPETVQITEIKWESSEPAVAVVTGNSTVSGNTVSGNDVLSKEATVTCIKEGTAKITAKITVTDSKGTVTEKTAECSIEVKSSVDSVTLNKNELELSVGNSETLSAEVTPSDKQSVLTWTSSNPEIAAVSENGEVKGIAPGSTVITAQAGSRTAECKVTVVFIPISLVKLEKDGKEIESLELEKGGNTAEITVRLLPIHASDKSFTCETGDERLVTPTADIEKGRVILTSRERLGKTTVKISAGGQTAELTVTVTEEPADTDDSSDFVPVRAVKLKDGTGEFLSAEQKVIELQAGNNGNDITKLSAEVLPSNATVKEIEWSSANEQVAVVTDGEIKAVGIGTTQIYAKAGNGVSDKVTVIVSNDTREVKIDGQDTTLYCNADAAVFADKGNLMKQKKIGMTDASLQCVYRSSNEAVATVDKNGLITALAPGKAEIIAVNTASGKSDSITVTVERLVEKIKLPVSETTIVAGTSMKLTAQVLPDKKEEKPTNAGIKWTVSDKRTAAIDVSEGDILDALKAGEVTVKAIAEDAGQAEAVMTVKVVSSDVMTAARLTLSYKQKNSAAVKSGAEITLATVVKDKDGTELAGKIISYRSSDEEVAAVDADGRVTAVAGGTAKITGTVMDGSNVTGSFTVKVEQRPTEITFDREIYQAAPGKTITLKPTVLPAGSKNKKVSYQVIHITDEAGEAVSGTPVRVHETNGKVTIAPDAKPGTKAVIRVMSTAFDSNTEKEAAPYKEVTVLVGETNVKKLTMKKKSMELVGIGAQIKPEFTVKKINDKAAGQPQYAWSSSDTKVVTVSQDGTVTAVGYGTAKVTLCADNAVSVSCTVSVYPVKKGQQIAAISQSFCLQSAENDGNGYVQLYFINTTTKSRVDTKLLTYTSSDPSVVYVDENGIAYANPKTKITEDMTVTVTAALKDDPLKRKAETTVTVWKDKQIKSIEFECAEVNGKTESLLTGFVDIWETEYTTNKTFRLKAYAYDAERNRIKNASLMFAVSDTELAEITETKDIKDSMGKIVGKYATVKVKNPGKFKITCMAGDKLHKSRQAAFGMYSGDPVLIEESLGSINKRGEIRSVAGITHDVIMGDTEFTIVGANGTEIKSVDIIRNSIKLLSGEKEGGEENGNSTENTAGNIGQYFNVVQSETDASKYCLVMSSAVLGNKETIPKGTYEITLDVTRSPMEIENGAIASEGGTIKTTFCITDSTPGVKIAGVSVNSFEKGAWTKLKLTTKAEVEEIAFASDTTLKEDYNIRRMQDGWYIAIKDEKFEDYASKTITGSFLVKLKGIEKPVTVSNVKIAAKSKKPALKQVTVPDIYTRNGDTAEIEIYNSTEKKNLTGFRAFLNLSQNQSAKWSILGETAADTMTVQLVSAKTGSYKQKIKVMKENWREPVDMTITVKASDSEPKLTFGKKSVTLNIHESVRAEECTIAVKANKSNLTFKTGEWELADSEYAKLFHASCQDGKLTIGLNAEAEEKQFTASSYKLQFKNVLEGAGYENIKTETVKVTIKKTEPVIKNVSFSGKLDLLNRRGSTLTGKISITGLDAEIDNIRLAAGEDENFGREFYCVPDGNRFTVYARSSAILTAGTYKGKVQVILKNGSVLQKDISIKTTQSTPKLTAPKAQTLYKAVEQNAAAGNTADYNLNACMPKGVAVSRVETKALPAGLGVEYDNGHAYVVLTDDTIKPGTYTIQADVYFKGAQKTADCEDGKAVRLKFNVVVKEQ